MENQNTPTPSGMSPGAASAGSANNSGRELRTVPGPNGSSFLEVWDTDERGGLSALVVSCCVETGEDPAAAVADLLAEFMHPFGAAWESPEQYGKELDAVKWLAEFYDVPTEKEKAEDALFDMIESAPDSCAQWELAQWLVSLLPPKAVKDLAARRGKAEGGSK